MAESSLVAHLVDLLSAVGPVRARAMMGGHMFHCGAVPIALLYDDTLYLKVDAATKEAFARAGGEPFTYERGPRVVEMSFWTPPDDALDDPEAMRPWAELALAAGRRARAGKKTVSRSRSGSVSRSGARSRPRSGSGSGSGSRARSRSR